MAKCTCIRLKTVDQRLTIVQQPVLSSGDVGTVRVEYEFDSYWDDYILSGTFYTGKRPEDIYEQQLRDGACVIPWEVLQEDGVLYIGLRGVDGAGLVKTAAPVRYRVEKGSPCGTDATTDPTPDVYQQLLEKVTNAEAIAQSAVDGAQAAAEASASAAGEAQAAAEASASAAEEAQAAAGTSASAAGGSQAAAENAQAAAESAQAAAEEAQAAAEVSASAAGGSQAAAESAQAAAEASASAAGEAQAAAESAQAAAEASASATYTASVTATWSGSASAGYTQTVSVAGILATDNPIIDCVFGTDLSANKLYSTAWGLITRITTADGSITLYANTGKPATAFTVQLKVVR